MLAYNAQFWKFLLENVLLLGIIEGFVAQPV